MKQLTFPHEEYLRLEQLLMQGYHYNRDNSTVSRSVRGQMGMQTDVWLPQEIGYKHWFTEYSALDLRVWYDNTIELAE